MKKIKIISILVLLIITSLTINTYAATEESFELKLETSIGSINPEETFSINIVLDNIKVTTGDLGIGAYSAVIKYDTNILEIVNATAATNWEIMTNEGNIIANTKNAEVVKEKQNTATIEFKVKKTAKLEDTEIKIENIEGSSGLTTINGKGISKKVTIKEKQAEKPNDNNQNTNTPNQNTPNQNTNTPNQNIQGNNNQHQQNIGENKNISTNTNKKATKLPYAGVSNILKILLVTVIITTILIYIKYRRAI